MGELTKIQWCDHTFNPWMGCAKVAPECEHCYAEALMDTRWGKVKWGVHGTRVRTGDENWAKVRRWNRDAPEKFGRKARVFCASLADVGEDRPELVPWRSDLCDLIRECDNLDFLLLTKRPENMERLFPADVLQRSWVGTSVGRQDQEQRIVDLLQCPAGLRFLSVEPMLGPVDLRAKASIPWIPHSARPLRKPNPNTYLDWVIVGGESGPKARSCNVEWVRSVVRQCSDAGVPCFVKQLGANAADTGRDWFQGAQGTAEDAGYMDVRRLKDRKGGDPSEWPEDLRVRQWPKGAD